MMIRAIAFRKGGVEFSVWKNNPKEEKKNGKAPN
jgi:hypothetical protein